MDGRHFDELSKLLAAGATRRQTLKALASCIAAAVFGWPLGEHAAAAEDLCCCRCLKATKCEGNFQSENACEQHCGKGKMAQCSVKHSCEGKTCRLKKKSGSTPAPTDLSYQNTPAGLELVSGTNLYDRAELDLAGRRASLFDLGIYSGFDVSIVEPVAEGLDGFRMDIYRFELGDETSAIAFLEENFYALPPGFADATSLYGVGSPSFAVFYAEETESGTASVVDLGAYFDRFVVRVQSRTAPGQEQPDQVKALLEFDLAILQGIFNGQAPDPPTLGFVALRFDELASASFTPLVANGEIVERAGDTPASVEQRQIQVGDALNGLQNNFTLDRFRITNTILEFRNPESAVLAFRGLPDSLQPVLDAQGVIGQVVSTFVPFLDETTVFDFARRAEDTSMAEPGITVWGTRGNYLTQVSIRDTVTVPADDEAAQQAVRAPIREGLIDILTDYGDLLRQAVDGDPSLRLTLMPPIALPPILLRGVTIDVPATGQTEADCETDADCVNSEACTTGECDDNTCEYVPVDDGTACGSGGTCCNGSCMSPIVPGYPCNECPCPENLECHVDICEPPYPLNFGPIPTIDVAAAGFLAQAPDGWKLTGGVRCLGGRICLEVGDGFFVDIGRIFDGPGLTSDWPTYAQRSVIPDGNGGVRESIVDVVLDNASADEGIVALTAMRAAFLAETGAEDFTGSTVIGDSSFVIRVPRGEGIDLDIGHVAGTILTLQRWSDFRGQTEVKQGRELAERKLRARSDIATAIEQGQAVSLAGGQLLLVDPDRVSPLVNQQYVRYDGVPFQLDGQPAPMFDLGTDPDAGQNQTVTLFQPIETGIPGFQAGYRSILHRFRGETELDVYVTGIEAAWRQAKPELFLELRPELTDLGDRSQGWFFAQPSPSGESVFGVRAVAATQLMAIDLAFVLNAGPDLAVRIDAQEGAQGVTNLVESVRLAALPQIGRLVGLSNDTTIPVPPALIDTFGFFE